MNESDKLEGEHAAAKAEAPEKGNVGSKEKKAEGENESMKESMLRLAAEFDNYKKRAKKDIDSAKMLGAADLMRQLFPILDEFELALLAISKSTDKNLMKGIEMVYSNMSDTLRKYGLREIDTSGKFDPYKHEIVLARESTKEPGTIIEVIKKGYMFNEMVLRPAAVIIAKDNESFAEHQQDSEAKQE
ncbi:MAG: nucleotide exchange factor GrpE [Candidatus Marsarchaeota archaeon]|jgi:molecular chaperone GrpE|nr:nucleotide exchange factor GrpE [Candidatus Marsarchaeota archaeon]MCL5112733.1 nucleotide exchange factor GrpE [Candidatus Marsarchaeota archaeon]